MKKILLIFVLIFASSILYSQNKRFCEIVGTQKFLSTKVTVQIDFGQETFFRDNRLADSTGKVITFNSMVDAMNYLGKMGWKFEQAYVVTVGQQNVYHWLLSKDDVGDPDDFKTKNMIKEEEKAKKKQENDEAKRRNPIYSQD